MCLVVDTNAVSPVFNHSDAKHEDFAPVLRWILEGKGKLVYGGSTYRREVFEKMRRYNRLFMELGRRGKCVVLDHAAVDAAEQRIRAAEPSTDFDDAHIVAIFDTSGCALLCSGDDRADRFVKRRELYDNHGPPKIYRRVDHRHLLCDDNIAPCCRPAEPLDGTGRAEIRKMLA